MSPSSATPAENKDTLMAAPIQESLQMQQPNAHQAMDPQQPHAEQPQMTLRGGQEGRGMCPGRFCFIIPCPIPINCCIFPCPC
ncbi:hypothetical protein GMORB2_3215 [Geosmithia morbida]|uniref:Uncharacterized protein n=1 Tax=Geosmithia morbida TaxID=1094350 RepID=A0A9P4YRF5_9HYPO|nr:uncharacterized protein GMORB2_3215 [Geosmithia morbida]KAF4120414.1 hypothetical protein GMORB2_3215 [Geosmithia morbida]